MSAGTQVAPAVEVLGVKPALPAPVVADETKKEAKVDVKLKPEQAARVDEIMKKIAEQVEFYLGDFNLAQDKFFRDLVLKDEGWVPLEAILKCNRVKKFTSNPDDIVNSLKKFSDLELDESGLKIKRKTLFLEDTEENRAARDPRTVYVKRFMKTATIDAMQDYFKKFGPIDGIQLNKFQDGDAKLKGKFKGSVHCIFKNKADAEAFVAAPMESTMFDGKEMIRAWKTEHAVEREQRLLDKKKEIEESKISGSVLHLSCQRQINYLPLREYFEKLSPIRYLDHHRGQREARVRFQAGVAKEILESILSGSNNKIIIDGTQYKGRVLEGKEEKSYFDTYWDTFLETKNNRILRNMRNDPKSQFKFTAPKPADKNGKKDDKANGHKVASTDAQQVKTEASVKAAESSHPAVGKDEVELKHEHDAAKHEEPATTSDRPESASKKRTADDSDAVDSKKAKSDDAPTMDSQAKKRAAEEYVEPLKKSK